MSERYSKLFSQQQNLYSATSPVVITAGALLKDNQSGKVLVQLKLRNINAKEIKAVKVAVYPFDTAGEPLSSEVEHQYLDLSAKRDGEFDAKTPIFLPDATARAFSAIVTEVIFADNSIWKTTGDVWETLPRAAWLEDSLQGEEMLRQYHLKYGEACKQVPTVHKDLWYCTCGALNRREEATCHVCACSLSELQAIDMAELRAECDERLAAEKAAAEVRTKEVKKTVSIVVLLGVLIAVAYFLLASVKYNNAVALMDTGQYEKAIDDFHALGNYKDSAELAVSCELSVLKNAKVGSYITFGVYEQDNHAVNGKEEIEWLVLDVRNGRVLLVSKYALDYKQYHTSGLGAVTWETCALRTWLNKDFFDAAFSTVEQSVIPTVTVSADKNPKYSTDPGNATQDKVFLLSAIEVEKYFASESKRQCKPTKYELKKDDTHISYCSDNGCCEWWLRTADTTVGSDGVVRGRNVVLESGVRPAIWVEIG